jgi:hypothetical protein
MLQAVMESALYLRSFEPDLEFTPPDRTVLNLAAD